MKTKLVIIFVFIAFNGWSQTPEIIWQQCYNIGTYEQTYSICPTENGYLIAKYVYNPEGIPNQHPSYEIVIGNIDTTGNLIWHKCFGGSTSEFPQKIIPAGNNEYFIFGKTGSEDGDVQSGNKGGFDLWVIRINNQGSIIWEKTYGSTENDTPKDFMLMPDGGFLMMGNVEGDGGDVSLYFGDSDIWFCKCDNQGNVEWEKSIGNEGKDEGNGFDINNSGNIILAGSIELEGGMIECTPNGFDDVFIMEMDMFGNILWQQCYGGYYIDIGYTIYETQGGYIVMASNNSSKSKTEGNDNLNKLLWGNDIWIIKTDFVGNILWQKLLGGSHQDNPAYLTQTEDDGYIIFGNTWSNDGNVSGNHYLPTGENTSDLWISKLSAQGQVLWQHCYGGVEDESLQTPFAVIKKNDHNYVLGAQSNSGYTGDVYCGSSNNTTWLTEILRCPDYEPGVPGIPSGPDTVCALSQIPYKFSITPPENAWTFHWKTIPDSAGQITNNGLQASILWTENFEGLVEVIARSANYCGYSQWSQPHYTQVNSCLGIQALQAGKVSVKVYPNPASDYLVFEIQNQALNIQDNTKKCSIVISDVFGQEVAILPVLEEKTTWNTNHIQNGIYYYNLNFEEKQYSGKLVIRK